MKSQVFFSAAVAGLICAPAFAAPPAAIPSPWTRVPAYPTACYQDQDQYAAKVEAALDVVRTDRDKQIEINATVEEKFQNIDPMEKARAMQQKMMSDPQNAAKYAQSMQPPGQDEIMETPEKEQQMEAEEKALIKRYQAALATANAPADARSKASAARAKREGVTTEGEGMPEWVIQDMEAIMRLNDQAYAATCPAWWGAGGQMAAYMNRYKTYLVQERVPYYEKFDKALMANWEMMGTPTASFKSLATFDAVDKYLQVAERVFNERQSGPRCTAERCSF